MPSTFDEKIDTMLFKKADLKTEFELPNRYEEVFPKLNELMERNYFFILESHLDRKYIKGHTGVSSFSWGEDMEVSFSEGARTKVTMQFKNCKSFMRRMVLKKQCQDLIESLKHQLNRSHVYN